MINVMGVELSESMTVEEALREMNKRGIFGDALTNHIAKVLMNEQRKKTLIDHYSEKSAEEILIEC